VTHNARIVKKVSMRGAWELARDFLLRPRLALDRMLAAPDALLREALWVYAAYLVTAVLFYALKPAGFPPPPPDSPEVAVAGGLLFWAKVHAWAPLLTLIWIAMTGWFGTMLQGGRLALRLGASVLCGAIPLLLILVYTNTGMPRWAFGLAWAGLAAGMVPGFRRVSRGTWLGLASVLLAVNAASLALLPLFAAAVLSRSAVFYHSIEIVMLFWTLGLAAYGTSRVMGLQAARAFCAVFLSVACQLLFVFSMRLLGLLPKEILKALLAA